MQRIQRKRVKGFKMPPNTQYVGRPTKWGNPVKVLAGCIYINAGYRRKILDPLVYYAQETANDVVELYKLILNGEQFKNPDLQYWSNQFKNYDIQELKDKNLACFCNLSLPCHVDVLIKKLSNKF